MTIAQFEVRIDRCEAEKKHQEQRYNKIANARLLVVIAILGTLYGLAVTHYTYFLSGVLVFLSAVFIGLMRRHQQAKEVIGQTVRLIEINRNYIARMSDEWKRFDNTGEAFLDYDHPYAYDLDIVGQQSLFQKINTTQTWHGQELLLKALLAPDFTEEELVKRQEAIEELAQNLEFCQTLEAAGTKGKINASYTRQLIESATTPIPFELNTFGQGLIKVLPFITLACIFIGYMTGIMLFWGVAAIIMIACYSYQFFKIQSISRVKGMLIHVLYELEMYSQLIEVIGTATFDSAYLKAQQDILVGECDARNGMKNLERLAMRAQLAYQPILAIPLNAIGLWDLKLILEWRKWQQKYGNHLEDWLQAIGTLESMISLSVLSHSEEMKRPTYLQEAQRLGATELGHRLIAKDKRIANDFVLDQQIFVITGSNMSGKTTFLRTIGINLVLAYAGAPVLAAAFRCSRMTLYTSMRIRDNLSEGISTFYAELRRIKEVVKACETSSQVIFLIDEIFRGTNSVDRIIGAKSVLDGVKKRHAIGCMTTHDLELCHLESENIRNYHFTEYYESDHIYFDYCLKEGPSTTTNARYLMKMVGIDIIDED